MVKFDSLPTRSIAAARRIVLDAESEKNYFSLAIVAMRNSTQSAVTNMTIKRMLENKII